MRLNEEMLERDDQIRWWGKWETLPRLEAVVQGRHRAESHCQREKEGYFFGQDLLSLRVRWDATARNWTRRSGLCLGMFTGSRLISPRRMGPRHSSSRCRTRTSSSINWASTR